MTPRFFIHAAIAALMAIGATAPATALQYRFEVETTPLAGQSGWLAFQLVAGGPLASSSVSVSDFTSDATLGTTMATGAVTGSLAAPPLTLSATTFYSEFLQGIDFVPGALQFTLDLSPVVDAGAIPDGFSFYLLGEDFVPFDTHDPTGADALFVVDLDDAAMPQLFQSGFATVSVVPEPPTSAPR